MTAGRDFRNTAPAEQVEPFEWVCRTCGYCAAVRHEPPQCPMCFDRNWELRPRRSSVLQSDPVVT